MFLSQVKAKGRIEWRNYLATGPNTCFSITGAEGTHNCLALPKREITGVGNIARRSHAKAMFLPYRLKTVNELTC